MAELSEAITTWAQHWNRDPKPFIWKARHSGCGSRLNGFLSRLNRTATESAGGGHN